MSARASFVYVSSRLSGYISILRLDPDGALSEIGRGQVDREMFPLAISPDRRHLYASCRGAAVEIASFRIDPATGLLTLLGRTPIPEPLAHISTDRQGRFLFGASYLGNVIRIHPIGSRGVVQAEAAYVERHLPNAHCMMADPSNRFVFAPVLQADMVAQLRFDAATGMLTPNDPPAVYAKTGHGPRHIKFHPNNRFAYVINELGGTLDAYAYDIAAGRLTALQHETIMPPGFAGAPHAAEIDIMPDGRFLYASERASSTLCAFALDSETGKLTRIGHYPTGRKPRCFAVDPFGRFVLAAGQLADCVVVHAIDQSDGALSEIGRTPVGKEPCWVEIVDLP